MRATPLVSVIVTTRNEARNLRHCMDSLAGQQVPEAGFFEVIVVDADSTDETVAIARSYEGRIHGLQVIVEPCTRGRGRNLGAVRARGELLVFIDADCIANAFWLQQLVKSWDKAVDRVVAGRTILLGYWAFTKLHRVELPHNGYDTTWPSCNLAYPRPLFDRLGGFDETFITAEDIDLNFRATGDGAAIVHDADALVYARARESFSGFIRQAFWNGYGRKQLTRKHGRLWRQYRMRDLVKMHGGSVWGTVRSVAGLMGYLRAKFQAKA